MTICSAPPQDNETFLPSSDTLSAAWLLLPTLAMTVTLDDFRFQPKQLRCENAPNPLGVDALHPRFSWTLLANDAQPAQRSLAQQAYQILVASSSEKLAQEQGDLWDSGKRESRACRLIAYEGTELQPLRRYWWQVRIWDEAGRLSNWSEPAWWETSFLHPEQWQARWIAAPDDYLQSLETFAAGTIPLGAWIWPISQSRVYLRRHFALPEDKTIRGAQIQVQCDNAFELYVNGKRVPLDSQAGWLRAGATEVGALLKPGNNAIAVKAWQSADPMRLSAALRAGLHVIFADGTEQQVLSDAEWQAGLMGGYYQNADPSDWATDPAVGHWGGGITCQTVHPRLTRHSLCFRKAFTLNGEVASARVYVTARGLYELRINGHKVGDTLLAPGVAEKCLYYQTLDVTKLLREGANVIAAVTGNGWHNSLYYGDMFSHKNELLAELRLTYADGRTALLATGSDWQVHASPLVDNDLQWGERYDARLEQPGWDAPGFSASHWSLAVVTGEPTQGAPLRAQPYEDIRELQTLKALTARQIAPDTQVFDFGVNAAGRCRLRLKRPRPGQIVTIKYGERLDADGYVDDDPYTDVFYPKDNDRKTGKAPFMTRNLDTYLCRGAEEETYEPRFVYTGFRYVQVSGTGVNLEQDAVTHRVFRTDYREIGEFACSNDLVNQLWQAIVLTARNNHHSGPTDCPTREKNFWNGDALVFAETACWMADLNRLYSAWTVAGRKVPAKEVAWIDEIIALPWCLALFYGDTQAAEANYEGMVALVEGRIAREQDGLYKGEEIGFNGDHVSLKPVPRAFFNAAYHYHSVDLLSRIAALLGRQDDARRYAEHLPRLAAAFNHAFFDAQRNTYGEGSQSELVMPLAFGIVEPARRQAVLAVFAAAVQREDFHPTTGFVCTPLLLPTLTEAAGINAAWKMVTQETYPSWSFMLKSGATAITETWHAQDSPSGFGLSLDHFALGSIGQWFFETLGGIHPDPQQPGFRHILFQPFLPDALSWARVAYRSPYGLVESAWKQERGHVSWRMHVPPNTTATIRVPCSDAHRIREGELPACDAQGLKYVGIEEERAVFEAKSGRYDFHW
jgi:alpha-L-rhamnosidase